MTSPQRERNAAGQSPGGSPRAAAPGGARAVDVVVVGAGAIGLSVAWRARERGMSVVALDRGALAAGASRVAAGMLAPVWEVDYGPSGERLLELGRASAQRWPGFADQLSTAGATQLAPTQTRTLVAARDRDEAEALEREAAYRERLGLRVERLRPSAARELEPALTPTLRAALELPDDHSVDPRALSAALIAAALRAGVELRPETPVRRVLATRDARAVTGVELESGERIAAGAVVIAAGAWSGAVEGIPSWARVPVRPVKGQIMRLHDPAGAGLLTCVVRYAGGYVVPRGDGRYVLGATVEERGFDRSVTVDGALGLLRDAWELVPGIAELVIDELGAGLRPGTPDNLPAIGPGALDGLVWATGHYRNGILLAPLTAELVASALAGEPPPALAASCAPARFTAPATAAPPPLAEVSR